jgi:hypothetical protein
MVCMINVTFDARITTKQMLAPERPKKVPGETKPAGAEQ